MKKLLTAAAALAAVYSAPAVAADMAVKAAPVVARPACAAAQFAGGYIGINGGGANDTANRTDRDELLVDASTYVVKSWGGTVGGQIGYNFANCNTLWGIEIDGNWLSNTRTTTFDNFGVAPFNNIDRLHVRTDGLITARGRGGVVLDNLLLYVTGGFAAVHSRTNWDTNFGGGANPFVSLQHEAWRWGWTAGFGTEYAFSPNWTVKFETLYVETLDKDYSFTISPFGTPFTTNFTDSNSLWVSRIGLNYRFGGPVVAKY